jgi:hypothetical protein
MPSPKKARPSIDRDGGTLCPEPDFLEFFSRNSLQWKYRLKYTLANGVEKQKLRRTDPTPRGQNPLFWKKLPEIRVQFAR